MLQPPFDLLTEPQTQSRRKTQIRGWNKHKGDLTILRFGIIQGNLVIDVRNQSTVWVTKPRFERPKLRSGWLESHD